MQPFNGYIIQSRKEKFIYTRVSKHQIKKKKYLKVINLYYKKEYRLVFPFYNKRVYLQHIINKRYNRTKSVCFESFLAFSFLQKKEEKNISQKSTLKY